MINVTIGNNMSRKSVIIDENTTLRSALEANNVDYTIGTTSLDGSTLSAGDLDKTFAHFGVTEKCYLLNVVKADNAAAVKIAGSACVVESSAKLEDIKLLNEFRPNALSLFDTVDGKKEAIFCVGVAAKGTGSVNKYGVSFAPAADSNGKAVVTMMIPEGTDDPKKWAAEKIGVAILHLSKVEAQFAAALEDVRKEQASVAAAITVL